MKYWKFDNTKLKIAREIMSLTQNELANKIAVSRQTYNGWETGTTMPTIHSLIKICSVLHVKPEVFFSPKDKD